MKKIIEEYFRTELGLDDPEMIAELIDEFFNLVKELLPQMRASFAQKDFPALRTLAHTLKGSSANVGAEQLRFASLHLQESAEARSEESCGAFLAELEKLAAEITA